MYLLKILGEDIYEIFWQLKCSMVCNSHWVGILWTQKMCIIIIVDENFGTKVTTKICCSFLFGDTHSEGQNSELNPFKTNLKI